MITSFESCLLDILKKKAIVKLRALILKIGYPEKIEEIYDRLQVVPEAEGGSLYSNESAAAVESVKYNLEKLTQPVDRTADGRGRGLSPRTVDQER